MSFIKLKVKHLIDPAQGFIKAKKYIVPSMGKSVIMSGPFDSALRAFVISNFYDLVKIAARSL